MFKKLFFLSGIIAFLLACILMYFWYLPSQSLQNETIIQTDVELEAISTPDTLNLNVPEE